MTKANIKQELYAILELYQAARPGNGTGEERSKRKEEASRRYLALPKNWHRKLGDDADAFLTALGNYL